MSVIPDPANNEATLAEHGFMHGSLVIHDALGKEVQRHSLSADFARYEFSTSTLQQGAYHYMVSNGSEVIGTGKLVIVR